jgi:hypothetical protein
MQSMQLICGPFNQPYQPNDPPDMSDPSDTPDSKITPTLVNRVSERLALAGEGVTRAEYKEHLHQHPELEELQEVAKQKFLENAFDVLLDGENAAANYRWLIELIYKGVIGSQDDESGKTKPTILGLPEEVVEQMRQNAQKL